LRASSALEEAKFGREIFNRPKGNQPMAAKTAKRDLQPSRQTIESVRSTMNSVVQSPPVHDTLEAARAYARSNPEAAALWCFGIGFVLGWKLKPW